MYNALIHLGPSNGRWLGVGRYNLHCPRGLCEDEGKQFDEEHATIQVCKLVGKKKVPLKM